MRTGPGREVTTAVVAVCALAVVTAVVMAGWLLVTGSESVDSAPVPSPSAGSPVPSPPVVFLPDDPLVVDVPPWVRGRALPGPGPGRGLLRAASDDGLGPWRFGDGSRAVLGQMVARLGEPDHDPGWDEYERIRGRRGWFEGQDEIGRSWGHRYVRVVCWDALCSIFGGNSPSTATFQGWELSRQNRWDGYERVDARTPAVGLVGSGIRLGATWRDFRAAYPSAVPGGGEGGILVIENAPWRGIFDGAGVWRMTGVWDYTRPDFAPGGVTITRMSGGEGPEPGCC